MPTYYVKLRTAAQPVQVRADANPEDGNFIGPTRSGTLVFKQGDREVGHFARAEVEAWWIDEDEDATVI